MFTDFHHKKEGDVIWWTEDLERVGRFLFSFDRIKIYNMFRDYPHNMTQEEVKIFDQENPYWADFFRDRK